MLQRIMADQSLQILVFICTPLLLLLVALITLLVRGSRNTCTFPTFSVTVNVVGREEAYVKYRDQQRDTEFAAQIVKGRNFFVPQIRVEMPKSVECEDMMQIVPKLCRGLAKLHYEFLIYRKLDAREISEEERKAALSELRELGFEMEGNHDQSEIRRAVARDWRTRPDENALGTLSHVQMLMAKSKALRYRIEVLARSRSVEVLTEREEISKRNG